MIGWDLVNFYNQIYKRQPKREPSSNVSHSKEWAVRRLFSQPDNAQSTNGYDNPYLAVHHILRFMPVETLKALSESGENMRKILADHVHYFLTKGELPPDYISPDELKRFFCMGQRDFRYYKTTDMEIDRFPSALTGLEIEKPQISPIDPYITGYYKHELRNKTFCGITFRDFCFDYAWLSTIKFINCKFINCCFNFSMFQNVEFQNSHIANSRFWSTTFVGGQFSESIIDSSQFISVDFNGTGFSKSETKGSCSFRDKSSKPSRPTQLTHTD